MTDIAEIAEGLDRDEAIALFVRLKIANRLRERALQVCSHQDWPVWRHFLWAITHRVRFETEVAVLRALSDAADEIDQADHITPLGLALAIHEVAKSIDSNTSAYVCMEAAKAGVSHPKCNKEPTP